MAQDALLNLRTLTKTSGAQLSESYDRNKLLGATNATNRRDALGKAGPTYTSRRGDAERETSGRDKEASQLPPWDRRDNLKSDSRDWRRCKSRYLVIRHLVY